MFGISLSTLPRTAKWLITLAIVSFGMTHLFAAALVWQVTTQVDASAKEHFNFKSFAVLLRMGHQHAFGHGTMYFLTGAVFLFAGISEFWTLALITGTFVGAWLDLTSWFLLKYGSERWELLSMVSGTAYAASFAAMAVIILCRLWLPSFKDARPPGGA